MTDMSIIDEIEEQEIDGDLKPGLTIVPEGKEFQKAISKIKWETASCVMGLTSPEGALKHRTLIIQKLWRGKEDHGVWHTMLLAALYKGNCKTNEPINWIGVLFKDRASNVICSIVQQYF
jgi:hypothetical protein